MSVGAILQKIGEDPKLKDAMKTLQLTEKSFRLLPLFPLLYVAWADGKLREDEVGKIIEIAEENGLTEGEGSGILSIWLNTEKKPSDAFFVAGLRLTAAILQFAQTSYKDNLVQLCESVAEASGGALGIGSVSGEEKKALVQIAGLLDVQGKDSYRMLIQRMQSELNPEELTWLPSRISPMWMGINMFVSLGVSLGIFLLLRSWHDSFVVSEQHQAIFLLGFLLLPQVGFFLSNVFTARMSSGNTIKESVLGSGVSIVLVMLLGAVVIGSTSKKYQGFNVSQPNQAPLFFPQCEYLKPELKKQRCIRSIQHKGQTIFRLMPNALVNPKKYPLGQERKDWFTTQHCKGSISRMPLFTAQAKTPSMYAVQMAERLTSKGYYPLCSELKSDSKTACLTLDTHPKAGTVCRIQSNPSAVQKEWGKKFESWFPQGKYCSATYARTYRLWKRVEQQNQFVGFFPACQDIRESNQACLYIQRAALPTGKKQRVCILSNSRMTPVSSIQLAPKAYNNWYPLKDCQESDSGLPLGLVFAALGFAIVAFFTSYFGGWVGERMQGNV